MQNGLDDATVATSVVWGWAHCQRRSLDLLALLLRALACEVRVSRSSSTHAEACIFWLRPGRASGTMVLLRLQSSAGRRVAGSG